jgi:hypothetical protein
MPKVFVSYSHAQREWVWGRLVPVLKAAGADVLIDVERFNAGVACFRQMDAEQDAADLHVLCFSDEYLSSKFCNREWQRAVQSDPSFSVGKVVPIVLKAGLTLPKQIRGPTPLHVNMRDDRDPEVWKLLLRSLRLDWNCCPVSWLDAAEGTARKLQNGECVNLLLPRSLNNGHRQPMEALLAHLRNATLPRKLLPDLKQVDLHSGVCSTLSGLLSQILDQAGIRQELPSTRRKALVAFTQQMRTLSAPLALTLSSCDLLGNAERQSEYGVDFFAALFDLTQPPNRKLSLLAISHRPYASLLPAEAYVSAINFTTIELRVT